MPLLHYQNTVTRSQKISLTLLKIDLMQIMLRITTLEAETKPQKSAERRLVVKADTTIKRL